MDKIYIGSNGKLAAVNPKTGEIIWQTKLAGAYKCDVSIIEKEDYLFVGCYGKIHGVNKQNGEVLWTNELSGWGYSNIGIAGEGISIQHKSKLNNSSSTD